MESLVLAAYVHNPINTKFLDTVLWPFYVNGESLVFFAIRKTFPWENLWLLPFSC